jgi:hypothetical protein
MCDILWTQNYWTYTTDCMQKDLCKEWMQRDLCCFDLDPVTMTPNCIIFPFRSIIPKRLNIFGWYLVGGCIRGQRCVVRKNCVEATFDLDSVTLKPNFPSALLNEWRFLVDIWCEDVSGDKGVSGKRFVSMWPLTLTQWPWRQASVTAHEVRALSASWAAFRGGAFGDVLDAATWSNHSTFSLFYLHDCSVLTDGMRSIGPAVAAQHEVWEGSEGISPF